MGIGKWVKEELQKLSSKYPTSLFDTEYDSDSKCYFIEIHPKSLQDNLEFQKDIMKFNSDFIKYFPYETMYFE